jgi:heme/copper-type cytochrome/quinol oxidase subunit 2
MEQAKVTWPQGLKIWWSYSWRAFVLLLLVMIPLEAIMFWFIMSHLPKPGTNATPETAARMAGMMAIVWPVAMAVMIALQVQAMLWMLKSARWSDFRVAVLPRDR